MIALSLDRIELLAHKFRAENELSQTEPINLKSLLRKLNILTMYRPLSDTFYGMSLQSENNDKFILVNSNIAKGRQHFTIAHELFHLFFDENPIPHICNDFTEGKNVSEKNADLFASALLMPYDGLLKNIPNEEIQKKKLSLATIIRLEQYYSVSRKALLIRLKSKSIISKIDFDLLYSIPVQESALQYGYDISLYKPGNEKLVLADFGEKARYLYEIGKITEGHYNELLNKIIPNE